MDTNLNSLPSGLTKEEAEKRLKAFGYNELESDSKYNPIQLFIKIISEPMFLLLLASTFVYSILGEFSEAVALAFSMVLVIGITFYQENKTERTLQALKQLSSPRARVIRDNQITTIAGREVVPEDIVIINEGDRIAADGLILNETNLFVDESLLTGESASVIKETGAEVFGGSLVVKGDAVVRITATGVNSEIGKIGHSLKTIESKDSLLKTETRQIVKMMTLFGLATCAAVIFLEYKTHGQIIHALLGGLTIAMSMVPEEFPVVLTIFLSFGAWKLAKHKVLTRRIDIIETLGAITALCVDKTGTLTMNKMRIVSLFTGTSKIELDEAGHNISTEFHKLLNTAMLASKDTPFDPMEIEIKRVNSKYIIGDITIKGEKTLLKEYPITQETTAITKVYKNTKNEVWATSKGAPESILKISNVAEHEQQIVMKEVKRFAENGLRVLGVAISKLSSEHLPEKQSELSLEFLGLIGFEDPVKDGIAESVQECYDAGISVLMLTGDYAGTAKHIARKIGLRHQDPVITGDNLEYLNETDLVARLKSGVSIFTRVQPLQKLKLVRALVSKGDIVAMTGDGVNDAPALKEAHVGIAMGMRGTDIAREASDMVLLDDDFNSIVRGIKQGRTIYENIKKAMRFIMSVHIPIAGMAIVPVALGLPTFMFPTHIMLLELLIDPLSTIVFEAEKSEPTIMKNKPRALSLKIFNKKSLFVSISEGLAVFATAFLAYKLSIEVTSESYARTFAFITMIVGNLGLVLTNRSELEPMYKTVFRKNKALVAIYGIIILTFTAILYIPVLADIFKFSSLRANDLLVAIVLGILSVASIDVFKLRSFIHTKAVK